MDDSPELTIGEVARRAGVATSAIRYYESIGLLPPAYRVHGQRRYGTDVLGRLAFVGVAQNAGFTLEEIKQLMGGSDQDGGMAPQMRALSTVKLTEVEALLARASAMKSWLEVANTCSCATPDECALFEGAPELTVVHVGAGDCRRS